MYTNKNILITGGTGSFGNQFVKRISEKFKPKRLIIYSRDEYKQHEMQKNSILKISLLKIFLGDVRDLSRLEWLFAMWIM